MNKKENTHSFIYNLIVSVIAFVIVISMILWLACAVLGPLAILKLIGGVLF